jgi:Bifunctional DNA primase/polymerase, N-terminal
VSRPDVLACALWLQRHLGAFVFTVDHPGLPRCAGAHRPGQPCDGTRGKHPCGKWSRDSTNDPAVITAALSHGPRNIGIDCGKSRFLVVDGDRAGAFAAYAASVGQMIPVTFTVATYKGAHSYLRQPVGAPLGNGAGDLSGYAIDIRGRGGFVVAPGSVHETGIIYKPVDTRTPVAPAPGWLIAALRPVPQAAGAAGQRLARHSASAYGRLRGVVATVLNAMPGERNNSLYWSACRAAEMVAAGEVDQHAAADVLTQAGEAIGLGSGEVEATIASALRGVGHQAVAP